MLFKFCVFLCLAGQVLSAFQFNPEKEYNSKFNYMRSLIPNPRFQGTLDYLKNVTNLSEKPCASFYEYTCGNYSKHYEEDWTPYQVIANNRRHLLAALHKNVSGKELKPVRLAKIYFQKCLEQRSDVVIPQTSSADDSMPSTPKSSEDLCVSNTHSNLEYAYERVFIESVAQGSNYTLRTREKLREMVRYIILGFRSMVNQVTWLTPNSRAKALLKLDYMAINLIAQNISMDDTLLKAYYQPLDFNANDSMAEIRDKIEVFKQQRPENYTDDRYRLIDPADMVNAHYDPTHNSINIPLGIVQTPAFNIDWPMEWNFGALGFIIGHEISHGFDNNGVEYDEIGNHIPWLEPESQKAFNDSAECLVEEYSKFCDVNNTAGSCVDGRYVLGEAIADVAGVHASFRGFELWKDTVGKETGLPATSGPLGHLEENQLFFLAQPQMFCSKYPTQDQDDHPPNKYRVRGPLPNFPAFSNAYNCKSGDEYAPKEHCNIWITPAMHKEFMLQIGSKFT